MKRKNQKLSLGQIAKIIKISKVSVMRLSESDEITPEFPKFQRIGKSLYMDSFNLFAWLSEVAGKPITEDDVILKGKDVQEYYLKSHTWIWQHVKAGNLPKPFKINRTNFWLERDIAGDVEGAA